MAHNHQHDGHSHHHHHAGNERTVAIAAVLTGSFMVAEVAGGLISGSLALIADAGHMLTDFAALMLAWFGFRLARRKADGVSTFGLDRFSVLAALFNGVSLFVIAGWITVEAVQRINQPLDVLANTMLWVAVAGLLVNIASFWILTRGEQENLNIRAALLHVLGDLLGSVAAIVASIVIMYTGWMLIDPILSVLVAVIILRSAWTVVKESLHILLESAPRGFDRDKVMARLEAVDGVRKVAHVHAWSITQERPMITLEITVADGCDDGQVKSAVKQVLADEFGFAHSTVEVC